MGDIVKDAIEEAFRRFPDEVEGERIVEDFGWARYAFVEGARFAAGAAAGAEIMRIAQLCHGFYVSEGNANFESIALGLEALAARAAARADEHSDEKSADTPVT
jgi:hypothetical protein